MGGLVQANGINIAGHKLPYGLVAAIAGVLGIVLYLRFRNTGVAVGALPGGSATAADTTSTALSGGVSGGDVQAPLANLSQQLSDLGAQLTDVRNSIAQGSKTPPGAPPPAPNPTPAWHFGAVGPTDTFWRWEPSFAATHGLSPAPTSTYYARPAPGTEQDAHIQYIGGGYPAVA